MPLGSFHRFPRPVVWELMGCKVQSSFKTTGCGGIGCQDTKTELSKFPLPSVFGGVAEGGHLSGDLLFGT